MRNIKISVPYKTSDKSWYYQHCLEETFNIFIDISQVIISHNIVINHNAAPLSSHWTLRINKKSSEIEARKIYLMAPFSGIS